MLKEPHFLPTLESRRKAAALGLVCKLLDGEGRGELQNLKPILSSTNKNPQPRRSKRINNQACNKFQVERISGTKSFNCYKRSLRGRIPEIWNG